MAMLEQEGKTVLILARSGRVVGVVAVADPIRAEVASALDEVRHLGIRRTVLLTGDNERVAAAIARAAGISEVEANLLPEDKIAAVKRLQSVPDVAVALNASRLLGGGTPSRRMRSQAQ